MWPELGRRKLIPLADDSLVCRFYTIYSARLQLSDVLSGKLKIYEPFSNFPKHLSFESRVVVKLVALSFELTSLGQE